MMWIAGGLMLSAVVFAFLWWEERKRLRREAEIEARFDAFLARLRTQRPMKRVEVDWLGNVTVRASCPEEAATIVALADEFKPARKVA